MIHSHIYVYFHAISMLFPLPRNQFFQLIQSHQLGRLGIMAHELQPVMPTAVPGPLKLTLPLASSCGPGSRCGDRSSKQSLNGQVGVLPERRWTNPKGVTNQTKNVPASEVLHFFMPTKNQQKWPNFLRSCWFEIHTCSLRPWGLRPTTCWSVLKQSAHRTLASCIFWPWKSQRVFHDFDAIPKQCTLS